jgi:diguanylate cyclase (GGDEF)-like protein
LALTADPLEAFRWAAATFEDLSLEVRHAGDRAEAMTVLERQPCDVALVAAALPDASYRDVLRHVRAEHEDLPVVLVGALDGEGIRQAIALGAADVVAPYDLDRLGPAVLRALHEALLATALQRARAEAALIDEALRRTRDDVVVVCVDDEIPRAVYSTRPDLVGRMLGELPFVCDAEEAEELTAAVGSLRSGRLRAAAGTIVIEPLAAPPYDRRYVAVSVNRDGASGAFDERDPVTGLPLRAAFERKAHAALADAERDGMALGVLFLDVDRFRDVNELGDHGAGDAVLREIAARLRDTLPNAYVARFGGDEFVLLCTEQRPGAIRDAAEEAIAAIAAPFHVAGQPVHLTASVGIATAPDDAGDIAALVGQAETAVFEAKRCGRNTVRWYRTASAASALDRMMLRHDLIMRSSATSWSCVTSRCTTSTRARSMPSKRSCAGAIPSTVCCFPTASSRWRKNAG